MRSPIRPVADLDDALQWVAALDEPHLVVVDLQPGVAHWSAAADDVRAAVLATADRFAGMSVRHVVWFLSNAPHGPAGFGDEVLLTWGGRKPFTRKHLQPKDFHPHHPVVVIGDQWVTDGLLALRMRGTFLRLRLPATGVPWWPRAQSRLGGVFRPFFRSL